MSGQSVLPPLYGDRRRWALIQADSLAFLKRLPDASIDAVVTDPPYGLDFEAWDGGELLDGQAFAGWSRAWGAEVCRVLKPGGWLAAFGAPRTFHRLVSGLEDSGLEVRDQLLWLFGSGVPKGRRYRGDRSTALKPAYEPILLARRPPKLPLVRAAETDGVGLLSIGETRVCDELEPLSPDVGRWPSNVALCHEPACSLDACAASCPRSQLDEQAGRPVSRFFYAAKAAAAEREAGLEKLPRRSAAVFAGSGESARANVHPTVKPLSVMGWLVRLVTPPGGVVLDPFTGSGSTGCAALLAGRQFVGIEREPEYAGIARARLTHWAEQAPFHA